MPVDRGIRTLAPGTTLSAGAPRWDLGWTLGSSQAHGAMAAKAQTP